MPGREPLRATDVDVRCTKRHQHNSGSVYSRRHRRDHASQISTRQSYAAFFHTVIHQCSIGRSYPRSKKYDAKEKNILNMKWFLVQLNTLTSFLLLPTQALVPPSTSHS